MMKLAILMPLARQHGGAEMLLLTMMRHGRGHGVSWLVIFLEDGPMVADVQALGYDARVVEAGRLREGRKFVRCVRQVAGLLREEKADLVLSWMAKAHLYGSPAARMAGVPALWYQHGLASPRNVMDRLAMWLPARGVLACSEAAARAQQGLRPARRTQVVYPTVELARFDPKALPPPPVVRRRLGLPDDGPLIGIVGRMQRWKGMHTLVDSMPRVLARYPDAHAVIVGGVHDLEADYPDFLDARIAALKLKDRVHVAGFQADVPAWMQAMDVIVHASDREPFGMVVVEAMALGKPVVAGDTDGPSEIIMEGVTGRLSAYGDAGELAEQILYYLDHPDEANAVGRAAQARAQAFSADGYVPRLLDAVGSLVPDAIRKRNANRASASAVEGAVLQ